MRVGPRAKALCKHFEGCKLKAYKCPAGIWTIGWGQTGPGIVEGTVWTQQQADNAFEAHIYKVGKQVEALLDGAPATAGQFGALVSFAYNLGIGKLASSTLLKLHKKGLYGQAAAQFPRWKYAGGFVLKGLVRRRAAERTLYAGDFDTFDKMIGYEA